MDRLADALAYNKVAMQRVRETPPPKGQKFAPGSRVKVADRLPVWMDHFSGKGKTATVRYTYAHAYGGDDVSDYCLDIDGIGESSWYPEAVLSPA